MMSDLVERLRAAVFMDEVSSDNPLGRDAADRIEALESLVRRLRERADLHTATNTDDYKLAMDVHATLNRSHGAPSAGSGGAVATTTSSCLSGPDGLSVASHGDDNG